MQGSDERYQVAVQGAHRMVAGQRIRVSDEKYPPPVCEVVVQENQGVV